MKELTDLVTDKRYRSRKWIGFLLLTIGTFTLVALDKDVSEFVKWAIFGYPAFCAANAWLKGQGVES
jgi:nitrate reductase NapE component